MPSERTSAEPHAGEHSALAATLGPLDRIHAERCSLEWAAHCWLRKSGKGDGHVWQRGPSGANQARANHPIWYQGCGTAAHLFIESAQKPPWDPEGTLDVAYFCLECRNLYGHLVKESELQGKFIAAIATALRR